MQGCIVACAVAVYPRVLSGCGLGHLAYGAGGGAHLISLSHHEDIVVLFALCRPGMAHINAMDAAFHYDSASHREGAMASGALSDLRRCAA